MNGFVALDKPVGITSQQAVTKVKRIMAVQKAGHTGTLDPAATGLLLVAMGKATRLSSYFLEMDKGYRAEIFFGIATATEDREGQVTERASSFALDREQIKQALVGFTGSIAQVPPAASAVKINGERAYKLFRQGNKPAMPPRQVHIHALDIVSCPARVTPENPTLVLDVLCSKGTYIRSLARDLGRALGCPAHLSALRRTKIGSVTVDRAVTLEQLAADPRAAVLDMDLAVENLPRVEAQTSQARAFAKGRAIIGPVAQGEVAVFFGNTLLGTGVANNFTIKPKRVLV